LEQRHCMIDQTYIHTALAGSPLLYPEVTRDVTGVYLQSQNALTETTDLTLGARYDAYSQIGSALSPRFGLTHQLSDTQTVKLLYGEAFRAPTTNELIINGFTIVGNPNLDPETIKTWELVWMENWQQHSLAISLFNNVIKNAIVRDDTISPATFVNATHDEASHGVEIEYIVELFSNWQLRSTYSWFNNLSSDDFRQADHLASAILNYQQQQWNFNLSATYAGARKMLTGTTEETLDSYWQLNSKLQYALKDDLKIYLQAKNLLDKNYETPEQRTTFIAGVPNRSRELEMGIQWGY